MSNVIYNDNDELIGYHKDLVAELTDSLTDYVEDKNWEEVKDIADLLLDLNGWADNTNLLVISANNGMGWTIREYKGE